MAAIFPAGSSREPIASLLRTLRRQLRLKNCLCHVRHIFLAFPLFSPLAPEVQRLFPLLPHLLSHSFSLLSFFSFFLYIFFSLLRAERKLFFYYLSRLPPSTMRRFASLIFFVQPGQTPVAPLKFFLYIDMGGV